MNYRLNAAMPEDEAWLEKLRRNVYQELFFATWGGWDEARHQRHFSACLARGHICIIEMEGEPVGMIQVFDHAKTVEVGEIQILPLAQSRGVGTVVLKDLLTRAHEAGKPVQLSVGLMNQKAYRLYERLGFQCVNRTETHYQMVSEPHS